MHVGTPHCPTSTQSILSLFDIKPIMGVCVFHKIEIVIALSSRIIQSLSVHLTYLRQCNIEEHEINSTYTCLKCEQSLMNHVSPRN
jgi:hypothetical protein